MKENLLEGNGALGKLQFICPPLHMVVPLGEGVPFFSLSKDFLLLCLPQRTHLAQQTDLCLSQRDQIKAAHRQSQY